MMFQLKTAHEKIRPSLQQRLHFYHFTTVAADTHHIEEHNDAEVNADRRCRGRDLGVVPDGSPPPGGEGADGDHAVDDDAQHCGDHHQDLQRQSVSESWVCLLDRGAVGCMTVEKANVSTPCSCVKIQILL